MGAWTAGRSTRDVMAELDRFMAAAWQGRHTVGVPRGAPGRGHNRAGAGREHQAGLDELARSYTLGQQATEHSRVGDALWPPPPMPPETVEEEAFSREICERLDTLIALQTERNLSRAVILAQQAVREVGLLSDTSRSWGVATLISRTRRRSPRCGW